jgi:hypothetical protein
LRLSISHSEPTGLPNEALEFVGLEDGHGLARVKDERNALRVKLLGMGEHGGLAIGRDNAQAVVV